MRKLTETELDELTEAKEDATTFDDTFNAWVEACEKLKAADPELSRGDLVIAVSRLLYLAGFRDGLETMNEGLSLDFSDLGL